MTWILTITLGILKKNRPELFTFGFNVNRDISIEEQILALNANEQMLSLSNLEEMNPSKNITLGIFIFVIHVPIVIIEDTFVTMDSILSKFVLLYSPTDRNLVNVGLIFILSIQSNPLDCLMIFFQVEK
jgi:hypothetical protein